MGTMNFIKVSTEAMVLELVNKLPGSILALDIETTDKNPRIAEPISIVISLDGITSYSVSADYLPLLQPLKLAKLLILQNFKYDYQVLYRYGLDLTGTEFVDTMLLHHLLDETKEHSLDFMVKEEFNDNYKEVFWSTYKEFSDAPEDVALGYECKDAIYTFRLYSLYAARCADRPDLVTHVHALAKALFVTELHGIKVNKDLMLSTKAEMGGRIDTYIPKLREEFNDPCTDWEMRKWVLELEKRKTLKGKLSVTRPEFNFGSTQQVQWLLYEHLKLPVLKKTEAKKPSTDYDTIEKLCVDYPILQTYKDYIEIKTIYGTFVEGLLERVEEGKIYPSFNVNGTVTGRISHSNPNMGNMPKYGPYRNFFLPDTGHAIIGADYSQLEVVIEANLTGDPNLAKIVLEGASKHDITAKGLGVDRDLAKTINFAMGYHCGVRKLSKLLKCSMQEAEYQWNKYWEIYKGCRDLKLLTDSEVDAGLPIKNLIGRVRHLPPMKDLAEWEIEGYKRQAYNFKIQGPGADFTNMAFYKFSDFLTRWDIGRALFSVHDEIVASVNLPEYEHAISELIHIMVDVGNQYKLKIPLSAKGYGPLDFWSKT